MYVYNRIRNKIFTVYVQYNNSRIYIWNYTTALDRDEHANHNSHEYCIILFDSHYILFSLVTYRFLCHFFRATNHLLLVTGN